MKRTDSIRTLVEALILDDLTSVQQFANVVFGLSLLASHQCLRTDDALKLRLQRQLQKWTHRNDDLVQEITAEDAEDVEALLGVANLTVALSDPSKVNLTSSGWSEQLRFGIAAVLAATTRRVLVGNLFGSNIYGAALLKHAYTEVFYLRTGVTIADFSAEFAINRAFTTLLVTQLQPLLDSETRAVSAILSPNADNFDTRILRIRFAMVAALSRLAVLECKND